MEKIRATTKVAGAQFEADVSQLHAPVGAAESYSTDRSCIYTVTMNSAAIDVALIQHHHRI